jgi:hypothetical protein
MALSGAVGGGSTHSRRRQADEQGRTTGHGRRGATRLTGGVGRQWGLVSAVGAGGRGVSEAARQQGADKQVRPAQCRATRFKLGFKPIQKCSNGSNKI